MAPVPIEQEASYAPIILVASHVLIAAYCVFVISSALYRSHASLQPAQETRRRVGRRNALAPLFATLAALSLALAGSGGLKYMTLSYKVWAAQRDIAVPSRLFGYGGLFGENATSLYLRHWLAETPVYLDAAEIVAEKNRRLWWGQQVEMGTLAWSVFVAIEGRRRNLSALWAYFGIAHLVSLSLAQNLFCTALVLTPSPFPEPKTTRRTAALILMRDWISPPKPKNWSLSPLLVHASVILASGTIIATPYLIGTRHFAKLVLASRLLTSLPLVLPVVARVSWGTVHAHPHDAYDALTGIFRLISAISFLTFARTTAVSLLYNTPQPYYHRHSNLLPFDTERRSSWDRTTTAFGRVLGSTADHPVVSNLGWDVIFSALGLGVWACVRALGIPQMLSSTIPFTTQPLDPVSPEKQSPSDASSRKAESLSPRRRGRPRKIKPDPDVTADEPYEPTPSEAAVVTEGDVLPDDAFDLESAALAWGLTALGGLGCGSAGVFGGECISR